ncbi:MAG TPA: hypothetical protein VIH01_05200 [Blastococcus sp.]
MAGLESGNRTGPRFQASARAETKRSRLMPPNHEHGTVSGELIGPSVGVGYPLL